MIFYGLRNSRLLLKQERSFESMPFLKAKKGFRLILNLKAFNKNLIKNVISKWTTYQLELML